MVLGAGLLQLAVKVALWDMGSFPDGLDLKSPLGRRLADGPPRHADV